jgi:hypothetical protein
MNRRNVFKMLAALPFTGLSLKAEQHKKDWLLVSPASKMTGFTNEQGEVYKTGMYSRFFMRFGSQSEAASFKSKLMPTISKELVGTPKEVKDVPKFAYVRSGYRGAIRTIFRIPETMSTEGYDWRPLYVRLVCVESEAAYSFGKCVFETFEDAWEFIDSLVIKEDDGESYSWERATQPFRFNPNQQPEFYLRRLGV